MIFLQAEPKIIKFSQGLTRLDVSSGDYVLAQIMAALPDIPEEEITDDFLKSSDLKKIVNIKVNRLADEIYTNLKIEQRESNAERCCEVQSIGLKEFAYVLTFFILETSPEQKYQPEKFHQLATEVAEKIVKKYEKEE